MGERSAISGPNYNGAKLLGKIPDILLGARAMAEQRAPASLSEEPNYERCGSYVRMSEQKHGANHGHSFKDRLSAKMRPVLRKLAPVAKVVEAATETIGKLTEPTVLGVINGAASGIKALSETLNDKHEAYCSYNSYASYTDMLAAFEKVGADIWDRTDNDVPSKNVRMGDRFLILDSDGEIHFEQNPSRDGTLEWMAGVMNDSLPDLMSLKVIDNEVINENLVLSELTPKSAVEIWERTRNLLAGGRIILLNGKPGCGKTTNAQAIARISGLGRVVSIDSNMMCDLRYPNVNLVSLRMISPAVVIVDDIDKVPISLQRIETLRQCAKLVIFTANNGTHDEVLDAAIMRPARVDEVFTIKSEHGFRSPPFDQLDDETWEEVCEWPHAWMIELGKRLSAGVDLRLDDLRTRLELRTRSNAGMFDDKDDEGDNDE